MHILNGDRLLQKIPPADGYRALDESLRQLHTFQWIVFTSRRAVEAVAVRINNLALPNTLPAIAVVGEVTAAACKKEGWSLRFTGKGSGEKELIDYFGAFSLKGEKILLPKSQIGLSALENFLNGRGGIVTRVEAYQTVTDFSQREPLKKEFAKGIDAIFLYSPSQWKALLELLEQPQRLAKISLYASGETTAEAIRQDGFFVSGLIQDFKSR